MRHIAALLLFAALLPVPAHGQEAAGTPQQTEEETAYREQVVVTASRAEEALVNAPATVSVVTSETIRNSPATNMGDLLRAVPGVNVVQTSARDVNLTTRAATGTLATSQLALVDGRSIYLDFFGMVMWDFLPTNTSEIRQVEVIRGPASAVWGANAMSGVVNVITKTPRELAAEGHGALTIGAGGFGRDVKGSGASPGSLFSINMAYADAVNEQWAYKVSGGYFTQEPLARPAGTIANAFRTPYPSFTNSGTSQPKFDMRVDYEIDQRSSVSFSAGVAGTDGLLYSGIGPFGIERGTTLGYVSSRYSRGARRIQFFTNLLNGNATNVVAVGTDRQALRLAFDTKTFDVDAGDAVSLGTRHLVSYGGNFRHNTFAFSLALSGDNRNEGGIYGQDEMFLTDHVRVIAGARVDKFSSIENAVVSPRATLLLKPAAAHSFRVSFNRAFRAPSYTNNNLDTALVTELNLGLISPALAGVRYEFPVAAVGNPSLKQETLTAYEIGYSGIISQRATATAAVYWNETDDAIFFTQTGRYTAAAPPPRWPLPPIILEALAAAGSALPSQFSYRNLGTVKDKGIELGLDGALNASVNAFANYSHQWEPLPVGFPISEINLPPRNRFSVGMNFSHRRLFGNASLHYTDEAFWQDVLDSRYHGTTEPYTLLNGAAGIRWAGGKVVTSVKATNIANREVMQHILGDVLKRQVLGELRLTF